MSNGNRWTGAELLASYLRGERSFANVELHDEDLSRTDLRGASFYYAKLSNVDLTQASLTHVQFKAATLDRVTLAKSSINASDLIDATFSACNMRGADLTGAAMNRAEFSDVDFTGAYFGNARLDGTHFTNCVVEHVNISTTCFFNMNLSAFCRSSTLKHTSASPVDASSVMRSIQATGLHRFMTDCGTPDLFAAYMIECARALDGSILEKLMQSTFISYGGPDEEFARKLYDRLRDLGVTTFFFPESARLGERINNEVYNQIQAHDRIILVCSEASLTRPGVLNEIQETLDREARDGGASYLLPIMIDDFVLDSWAPSLKDLADRVRARVVGDFRGSLNDEEKFAQAFRRLTDALMLRRPH